MFQGFKEFSILCPREGVANELEVKDMVPVGQ